MTHPQQKPQHEDMMAEEIDRVLREGIARPRLQAAPAQTLPPASSNAPRGVEMWGPTSPRVTSPLELLSTVADNTAQLREQLEALVTKITGEQPPVKRLKQVPRKGGGLLPTIAHLAHDIDEAHADLARLINHVARQL